MLASVVIQFGYRCAALTLTDTLSVIGSVKAQSDTVSS